MRRPSKNRNPVKQQTSTVFSISSPTGGWNARDSVANMAPNDAIRLKNWFPTTTDCEIRGGNTSHATGVTGTVESLMTYNAMNGTNKMYAASDSDIWDVTSAGAAVAKSATVTNGRFQNINFGDGTSNYLIMVNGVDAPIYFDGTTFLTITGVTSPLLSGVTLTSLIHVNEYKGRLFFIEKDTLSFWYLAAGAAGGALTEFDLSSFCVHGGYLMWMATWSFDSGDGPDDAAVFMTSEGEVIVYRGTNPSAAADWVLTGTFYVGKPLGRRSFVKFGGDLIAITQDGAFPLSKALQTAQISNDFAVTNKIEAAFTDSASNYGSNFGWEAILHPLKTALIFNIPIAEGGEHKQYVMNTITTSWCEFDMWNAECFAEHNDEIYFGSGTAVYKAWSGTADDGSNIIAEGKTAFNYLGESTQQKKFNMFRPMLNVNGDISFLSDLDTDFRDDPINGAASYSATSSAIWDTAVWDAAFWTSGLTVARKWSSPSSYVGFNVAGKLKVETNSLEVHWIANDYVYEHGGVL